MPKPLWAPWRLEYIQAADEQEGCVFCLAVAGDDEEKLVVHRGRRAFVLLNKFPYSSGHLMVAPYRHVADYTGLTHEETVELAEFTQRAMTVTRRVAAPHGFNIGMNQGVIAGAGIAAHLHQHVVPRWGGDTNFMPVVGRTKVLPQLLVDTRRLLAERWAQLT